MKGCSVFNLSPIEARLGCCSCLLKGKVPITEYHRGDQGPYVNSNTTPGGDDFHPIGSLVRI